MGHKHLLAAQPAEKWPYSVILSEAKNLSLI